MAGEKTSLCYCKIHKVNSREIMFNSCELFAFCGVYCYIFTVLFLCYMSQRICWDKISEAMCFMIFIILIIYLLANIHCTGIGLYWYRFALVYRFENICVVFRFFIILFIVSGTMVEQKNCLITYFLTFANLHWEILGENSGRVKRRKMM